MADLEERYTSKKVSFVPEYRLVLAMDHLRHLMDARFHFRQDPSDLKRAIKLAQDVLSHTSGQSTRIAHSTSTTWHSDHPADTVSLEIWMTYDAQSR